MSTGRITSPLHERDLLDRAKRGDEAAYRSLVEPHRSELHAHCYRMLGSVHDAEDALQDAFLRVWRFLPRFEGRSSLRSWLYKIATNACLDAIQRRPKRVLPVDYASVSDGHTPPGEPVVESVWIEPYPDEQLGLEDGFASPDARYERREGVELAFIAALQHLPATQRAVLILREVLGFSAAEVSESLETTVASVNSALQRARKAVEERLPEQSQQATLRTLGDEKLRELVERYVDAWERNDVEAVVSMLTEDAAITMPPLATWYGGHEGIGTWLRLSPLSGQFRWKHLLTHANGQPALAAYHWDEGEQAYLPFSLGVVTLRGEQVLEVDYFIVRTIEVEPSDFERWPDHEADAGRLAAFFERFRLPDRITD
jgi:RNA polymerase sigma-70 factor (ECF subfamily)